MQFANLKWEIGEPIWEGSCSSDLQYVEKSSCVDEIMIEGRALWTFRTLSPLGNK